MRSRPELVTVVVPVLNEAHDFPGQLEALSQQTYPDRWELLVCDNGSVDGTQDVAASWKPHFDGLRIIDASDAKGCNHARNVGIANAGGEFIAFCDADDVVSPGWLTALVDAAPEADVVGGSLEDFGAVDPGPVPDQLYVKLKFLPSIPGGNCGVWADVARDLLWDEEYGVGGSDIEFAWRAQLAGYRLGYARDALVQVRRPDSLRVEARQWYGYGASEALLFRKFRQHGVPRSRQIGRHWAWLVLHVGHLLRPGPKRVFWVRKAALRSGRIGGSVAQRVLFL